MPGSKRGLPGAAGSHHGTLQLLVGDEHHHVPGAQAQEGGHEPAGEEGAESYVQTGVAPINGSRCGYGLPHQPSCDGHPGTGEREAARCDASTVPWAAKTPPPPGYHSPLVTGQRPLRPEHSEGAAHGAAVLARGRVHVSGFHDVDGGGDERGAEAGPERRGEVAREVICRERHQLIPGALGLPSSWHRGCTTAGPKPSQAEREVGAKLLETNQDPDTSSVLLASSELTSRTSKSASLSNTGGGGGGLVPHPQPDLQPAPTLSLKIQALRGHEHPLPQGSSSTLG